MHDILDLERYPLDRPSTPEWQALVDRYRAELAADGMFSLEGLMKPEVAQGAADALKGKFETESFHHKRWHNIYFKDAVDGLAPDHPALQKVETSNFTLCADQLPDSPVLRLYDWPPFAEFLAATMDKLRAGGVRLTRACHRRVSVLLPGRGAVPQAEGRDQITVRGRARRGGVPGLTR